MLSNKIYDALKWVALIALPAVAVFWTTIAQLWGWGHTKEVVGTIMAVDVLLGALLQLSSAKFKKNNTIGSLSLKHRDPDTGMPHLEMDVRNHTADEILQKSKVILNVEPEPKHRAD